MMVGARFAKWGIGLFIFGVFLSLGIIAHYCVGSHWRAAALLVQGSSLWWACPWTFSVAAVQAGGLGMVALGATLMTSARLAREPGASASPLSLWFCIFGLLGVFAVGYPGYFLFDALWPSFYFLPLATGKTMWLVGQGLFILLYFVGMLGAFSAARHELARLFPMHEPTF